MLIHVQLQLPAAQAQTKTLYSLFNKLVFTEQLRLKILKKLRTASFNSEFTGSYKKKCI